LRKSQREGQRSVKPGQRSPFRFLASAKPTMVVVTTILAATGVAALLPLHLLGGQGVSAQGTVNFDIDPETSGNTASTLGTVEDCYEVIYPSAECDWDGSSSFDDVSDYIAKSNHDGQQPGGSRS